MELVVEATGVADGVSRVVSTPKWGDGGATIEACNGHVRVLGARRRSVGAGGVVARRLGQFGGFFVRFRMLFGFLFDHHPIVVSRTPSAGSGTPGSVTVAVSSTRALLG